MFYKMQTCRTVHIHMPFMFCTLIDAFVYPSESELVTFSILGYNLLLYVCRNNHGCTTASERRVRCRAGCGLAGGRRVRRPRVGLRACVAGRWVQGYVCAHAPATGFAYFHCMCLICCTYHSLYIYYIYVIYFIGIIVLIIFIYFYSKSFSHCVWINRMINKSSNDL